MSKRLCICLLHGPVRSQLSLQRCALQTIPRGDPHHHRHLPKTHNNGSHRQFSSSPTPFAANRAISKQKTSQPSMAAQMKRHQKTANTTGQTLEFVGLVEGTFVPPTGPNLPSIFSSPKNRWKIERYRLANLYNVIQSYFVNWWYIKPRMRLEYGQIPGITKQLYQDMYHHFARGTLTPIQEQLSPGFMSSLKKRLQQRREDQTMEWTLHRYIGSPKVVSYKFAIMQGGSKLATEQMGIIQAIVRIKSEQSLIKMQKMLVKNYTTQRMVTELRPINREGVVIPEEMVEQEKQRNKKMTTEYVVLQRLVRHSKPGPWHLWGTAEETTLDKIEMEERARSLKTLQSAMLEKRA